MPNQYWTDFPERKADPTPSNWKPSNGGKAASESFNITTANWPSPSNTPKDEGTKQNPKKFK